MWAHRAEDEGVGAAEILAGKAGHGLDLDLEHLAGAIDAGDFG